MLESLVIKELKELDNAPMELLLLADPSAEIVEDYIRRGNCYTAELDDQIIGVYVLLKTRAETIELVNIAVDEQYQGQGFGKYLVLDAIKRASLSGAKTLEVGTGNAGIMQLSLYQKCGFRIVGVDYDFFIRHYSEPIFENGIQCRDMIRLRIDF